MGVRIQSISGKWTKSNVLLKNKELGQYVPTTKKLNSGTLLSMLKQYKMVYVKPNRGTGGYGVIRVEQRMEHGGERFSYQLGIHRREFTAFLPMYQSLCKHTLKKDYLVQKGIRLLKFGGRPFDIRIMVQKSPGKKWETTGSIGRLAHPKKIVTNYHSGGTPMALETLLRPYLTPAKKTAYIRTLGKLSQRISNHLQHKFSGLKEIGVDIGLDQQMKPWILEVNTRPDLMIFNQLKDKRMFRKMCHYAKMYGRFNRKKGHH